MDTPLQNEIALVHFEAAKNFDVKVLHFMVDEALSSPFAVVVNFLGTRSNVDFDAVVGRGAALTLYTSFIGERVWSGIVSELELLDSGERGGGATGTTAHNESRFKMTIRPALWRLSLRRNCRIFQHQTIPEIVEAILKEWDIQIDKSRTKLTDTYQKLEFKVQYHETDFDFVSRLLEEAGISYWLAPGDKIPEKKTPGRDLTKIVLEDRPQDKKPTYPDADKHGHLQYLGDSPNPGEFDQQPQMWGLTASQSPRPLRVTVRDRNFRGRADQNPEGEADAKIPQGPGEEKYETYLYHSGIFWTERLDHKPADKIPTPLADEKQHKNRPDKDLIEATGKGITVAERLRDAVFTDRTHIRFATNALDLEPGCVFQIGKEQDDPLDAPSKHPHPAFAPTRKLMIVRRTVSGTGGGSSYRCDCLAVFASPPGEGGQWPRYRPMPHTPKPRIGGVQSAVVVGPQGKEIYTDEFGRVRVQFPWDREHDYDENSSCWVRVSQSWAGGGFGAVMIPRVGHEVLVAFFDGDPDQPIIVGRVYNATTNVPYFPVTKEDNWTKTAIRTDSTPHRKEKAGYNELMFQDARGKERIHIQAQRDLSIVVNSAESHDVGSSYSIVVGGGKNGPSTSFKMSPSAIELRAPGCSLVVGQSGHGSGIHIEANNTIHVHSGGTIVMNATGPIDVDTGDEMTIDTVKELYLNCTKPAPPTVNIPDTSKASAGGKQAAPYLPDTPEKDPPAPGAFDDVKVGLEPDEQSGEQPKPGEVGTKDGLPAEDLSTKAPGALANAPGAVSSATKAAETAQGAAKAAETAKSKFDQLKETVQNVKKKVDNVKAVVDKATTVVNAIKKGDVEAAAAGIGGLADLPQVKDVAAKIGIDKKDLGNLAGLSRAAAIGANFEKAAKAGNIAQAAGDISKLTQNEQMQGIMGAVGVTKDGMKNLGTLANATEAGANTEKAIEEAKKAKGLDKVAKELKVGEQGVKAIDQLRKLFPVDQPPESVATGQPLSGGP